MWLTAQQEIIPSNSKFLQLFLDLLKLIFVYDPAQRITATKALEHPWFREPAHPDDGTEATKLLIERLQAELTSNRAQVTRGSR
jgi:dual-specificity kinase